MRLGIEEREWLVEVSKGFKIWRIIRGGSLVTSRIFGVYLTSIYIIYLTSIYDIRSPSIYISSCLRHSLRIDTIPRFSEWQNIKCRGLASAARKRLLCRRSPLYFCSVCVCVCPNRLSPLPCASDVITKRFIFVVVRITQNRGVDDEVCLASASDGLTQFSSQLEWSFHQIHSRNLNILRLILWKRILVNKAGVWYSLSPISNSGLFHEVMTRQFFTLYFLRYLEIHASINGSEILIESLEYIYTNKHQLRVRVRDT